MLARKRKRELNARSKRDARNKMLGYITKQEALELGMTHHGSYYGLPVWIGPAETEDGCRIYTKWQPLDYMIGVFCFIENIMRSILFPEDEPMFQISIGKEIK